MSLMDSIEQIFNRKEEFEKMQEHLIGANTKSSPEVEFGEVNGKFKKEDLSFEERLGVINGESDTIYNKYSGGQKLDFEDRERLIELSLEAEQLGKDNGFNEYEGPAYDVAYELNKVISTNEIPPYKSNLKMEDSFSR